MLVPQNEILDELRRRLRVLNTPPERLHHLSFENQMIELIQPFCDYFLPAWLRAVLPSRDTCDRETVRAEVRRLRDEIIQEIVAHTLDELSIEAFHKPFPPPPWRTGERTSLRLGREPLTPRVHIRHQINASHGYLEREIPFRFRHIFRGSRAWAIQQLEQAVPPAEIETLAFMYPATMPAGSGEAPAAATISTNSREDVWPLLEILHLSVPAWSARTAGIVPEDAAALGASSIYAYLNGKTRRLRGANERKLYLALQKAIKAALARRPKPAEERVLRAWLETPLPK
jgi:hypothetical protein